MGVATIMVVLGVLAISPQAAAAMRHLLGFIPGLGVVDQRASWYVLTEPVSQSRSGVKLTVETASADPDRTVVLIQVEGLLPPLGAPSTRSDCTGSPRLVAGGEAMAGFGQRQEVWGSGYTYRLVFPAMPAGETQAELQIPCLLQVVPGAWPEDWLVPLSFSAGGDQPVEPAYQPRLAIEGSPTEHQPMAPTGSASAAPILDSKSQSLIEVYGISPKLESVVQQSDGMLLFGTIGWMDSPILEDGVVMPLTATLSGANGEDIPIEPTAPDQLPAPGSRQTAWAFHAMGGDFPEPLTLSFHGYLIGLPVESDFDLAIDPDRRPGQGWQVDRRISIGLFDVRVVSAALKAESSGSTSLSLTLDSNSGVVGALVLDRDHPEPNGGGGGGTPMAGQPFTVNVNLPAVRPDTLHLSIGHITVFVDETSSIIWTGPSP